MKPKFYITTPIYYASAKPHIGHAFTSLYADVLARYHCLKGEDVFFATGMDEHGSKIAEAAAKSGKNPKEFVDQIARDYEKIWQALGIEYSDFIRTTSKKHEKGVFAFLEKLKEAGDIYPDFYEGFYCVGCENFVLERNLINGLCPDHLKAPQKIKEKNYFFNLKKYLFSLKEKIISGELKILPESRKNEILSIIDSEIPDFSISREHVSWGIPFPFEKSQTVYVWVEALMNYVTILDFPGGKNFKKFWPADVHVIGAEINKFHSIFWPALLLSVKLPLPKSIFVHGLFTVNGQKMSKTLGNVIDPLDMVNKFGVDGTRYLLLSQFSALEHGDIKESEFVKKYNADLANGVGNLAGRVLGLILRSGEAMKEKTIVDKNLRGAIEKTEKDFNAEMKNFKLFEALQEIFSLIKVLDKYIDEKKPWQPQKENSQELEEILNNSFLTLEKIAEFLEPFLPSKIVELKSCLLKLKKGDLKQGEAGLNLFPRLESN